MDRLRVIQWNTGKVGRLTMQTVIDHPNLDLVGVFAHSPDKVGKDAGDLCDRPKTGITATSDIDELIATGADTVIYTPFTGDVDHAVKLLENGMNILSTNLFFHVGGVHGEVRERFEAACQKGNSSIYITGINPGWINSVAIAMTAVCTNVEAVAIYESANGSTYESPETWNYFGLGQYGCSDERIEAAKTWLVMFRDAVLRVGDALGFVFDDMEFYCEYATAAEDVDLGWFRMDKGSNAAVRAGWLGKSGGKTRVKGQITWYLTTKLVEGWEISEDEYHLVVDGEPGVDTRIRFKAPEHWTNSNYDSLTSMPTINAIFQVNAARPGVLNLHDVGLPYAMIGATS